MADPRSRRCGLLLVEDDVKLARALERGLRPRATRSTSRTRATTRSSACAAVDYDAIVLDVMLPGADGFAVCRALRERERWCPC